MSKGAILFLLFFVVCISATNVFCETLLGDSSIFGRLRETRTAEFVGDRGAKIIEDKIFLYNKSDSTDRIQVLDVPSLNIAWSLNGSYFYVQPSEGKKSYAILYSGDSEGPNIDVYQLTGKRLFALPNHDGEILATPNGELFYPSDWGINGIRLAIFDQEGQRVPSQLRCFRGDEVARSLNDSILVVASYPCACIFSMISGKIYDSIPYPRDMWGGHSSRSKNGGQVLLNWRGTTYFIDSSMKFQEIEDSIVYPNKVSISPNGKFGYLITASLDKHVFAYDLNKRTRIWSEKFERREDHSFGYLDVIVLNEFICIRYDEIEGTPSTRSSQPTDQAALEKAPKSMFIQLDPETGVQIDRAVFDGTITIGYIGDDIFTLESEFSEGKEKLVLKVWE